MKKFIVFMAAFLIFFAFSAMAEEEKGVFASGDYEYVLLTETEAEIFKYLGDDASVMIPEQMDGYSVVSIGEDAFSCCMTLKEVTLPETVVSIEKHAFIFCLNLEKIVFPSSLRRIGDYVFCGCEGLTDLVIPDGVVSIGVNTFLSCDNLKTMTISDSVTQIDVCAFLLCDQLTLIVERDSYAEEYAKKIEIPFAYADEMSNPQA